MSYRSDIEWTEATWNPVRGCTKVSPGCKHCYAALFAERWRGIRGHPYEQGFDLRLVHDKLLDPLLWRQPRTIFVNSMSDLFQSGVPDAYVSAVFDVMHAADWHVYQVLTKRPERMREFLTRSHAGVSPAGHIWLGVSVEDKEYGVPRIAELRRTPASIRFLSIEPLLEDLGDLELDGIDWVIVGGESGPGARPMNPSWVRSILSRCEAAGVPFFFKQWGGVHKSKAGRLLDGRSYDELPRRRQPVMAPSSVQRRHLAHTLRQSLAQLVATNLSQANDEAGVLR